MKWAYEPTFRDATQNDLDTQQIRGDRGKFNANLD